MPDTLMMQNGVERCVGLAHVGRDDLNIGMRVLVANHIVQGDASAGTEVAGMILGM